MGASAESWRGPLAAAGRQWSCVSLARAYPDLALERVPRSLRILLENIARRAPDVARAIRAGGHSLPTGLEVPFHPGRVLMHDTTCLPALADFAAMRDAVAERGGNPRLINPVIPVHLVIDHSISVEYYGTPDAPARNIEIDFHRNIERYRFVKWAEQSLSNFRVVPPGTGIIHQINLELLAEVISVEPGDRSFPLAYPDAMIGTDSHTPMVNALGMLAWGVGGVEAQAAMLGEPVAMTLPEVVGARLVGAPRAGVNATDLVLHLTALLRAHGVVGRFVEFFGPGVARLALADRATIANMAPEYGATCAYFPIDPETLRYLRLSGRPDDRLALVEAYARAQGLWHDAAAREPDFASVLEVDLGQLGPTVAGPRHPHDRKPLGVVKADFFSQLPALANYPRAAARDSSSSADLDDGAVALAAITSCTNTSNPALLVAAGLLARNARRRGLKRKPWVKTSFSPGSAVVARYMTDSGLQADLDALGFNVVGMGCMTCIGNSGRLEPAVIDAVEREGRAVVGVLSGNRNFDGRVNSHLAGAYLMSPALVVAYAIVGRVTIDLEKEPLGTDAEGKPAYLAQLWPSETEIADVVEKSVAPSLFRECYADVWRGPSQWRAMDAPSGDRFQWDPGSDYIRRPPYFDGVDLSRPVDLDVRNARLALSLGDNVTTDHISPAGTIPPDSLAGRLLASHGLPVADFNQYSTRRSNHEIMMRGAFSNPRLRNELIPGDADRRGAFAWNVQRTEALPFYEVAMTCKERGIPLVIAAGKNYGAGSSRDIAAKVTALLGVRIVIAESYERIHRSNLIALGVVPLLFPEGTTRADLGWDGSEALSFEGLQALAPGRNDIRVRVQRDGSAPRDRRLVCRVDSRQEIECLRQGGILRHVLRRAVCA